MIIFVTLFANLSIWVILIIKIDYFFFLLRKRYGVFFMKKVFAFMLFLLAACVGFSQSNGYFIGDGASGKRVLVYTSTIENGKSDDAWIAQKVKRDIISDFVNYSNIDVIDSDEKNTILKLQKDSESAYYSDVNPIELGKAISAKSYIKIVSTKKKDTFSVTVTVTNIETGKTENSYTSSFYPENEFITKVHGEASADLLEKMGVKLTPAGKRLLQYGTFTQTSTESAENLETYKAEIARLEKEQSELMKNRNTEVDAEAQAARIETQKQMLLQQQKNEEERLARLREDENRKAEEERLSKERNAESQKRIVALSKEIEEKATKIREKKLEGMSVLQQIDVIEGEKQVLFQNEQTISQNLENFNLAQDNLCKREIVNRKVQTPKISEMNADGSLNDKGLAILESDIEAIEIKYEKIKKDNEQQVKDSAGKLQETLRKKIINDINLLENKSYTVDSLQNENVYFRVGNYDGSAKSEGWNYNISFVFAGKTIYSSEGLLSYKNVTGLDVPKYPNASDPKRDQKIKAYNEYQDNVEVYDSFFRMNVPYIRAVLTYSVKVDDVKNASQYIVTVDKIEFVNVQTNLIVMSQKVENNRSEYVYNPKTFVNWNLENTRIKQAKKEERKQKRNFNLQNNPKIVLGSILEGNLYSINKFAPCVGLLFEYFLTEKISFGLKGNFSYDISSEESKIFTIEPQGFSRYYISPPFLVPNAGIFLELQGGAALINVSGDYKNVCSAGGEFGYRFVMNQFYIEPYLRGGYPFITGAGLSAGIRF